MKFIMVSTPLLQPNIRKDDEMSMKEMLKVEDERRKKAAADSREYRQKNRNRPEPKVIDRVMLESLVLVLADRGVVDAATAEAIGGRVADLAQLGMQRLGYDAAQTKMALAVRLVEHARYYKGSAVKPALTDLHAQGVVVPIRDRSVAAA